MYEILQILAKIVIVVAILLVAGFATLRVWRADIDLRQLISPRRAVERSAGGTLDWMPTRDPNSLYQEGQVVGTVAGADINEAGSVARFAKVSNAINLDLEKEFEFQKWRLTYERADIVSSVGGLAMAPTRSFGNMACKIIGTRPF